MSHGMPYTYTPTQGMLKHIDIESKLIHQQLTLHPQASHWLPKT